MTLGVFIYTKISSFKVTHFNDYFLTAACENRFTILFLTDS